MHASTYSGWIIALATTLGAIASPVRAAEVAGGTLEQWTRHRDALRMDPSLLRYYTFERVRQAGEPVANLATGAATRWHSRWRWLG